MDASGLTSATKKVVEVTRTSRPDLEPFRFRHRVLPEAGGPDAIRPSHRPSSKTELDPVRASRIVPVDRVFPEVLADDRARAELDASFRVVHEISLVETVDLRWADVQARLRIARSTDVRVDRDERFLVELEPVQSDPFVHGQELRGLRLRGLRHAFRRREAGHG